MTQDKSKWGGVSQYDDNTGSQSSQLLKLDEIKMDATNGKWYRKCLTQDKVVDPKTKKEVYPKIELPETDLEVIIIKGNRRRLVKTGKAGKKVEETREFSDKSKPTELSNYELQTRSIVIPEEISKNGYKTHNYIYCLYNGELVKLVLKGGQVKTTEKIKGIVDYFSYLFSFSETERPYMFKTILIPTAYSVDMGDFYTLNFKKGDALDNDLVIDFVKDSIKKVGENLKVYDSKNFSSVKKNPTVDNNLATIDYGDEPDTQVTGMDFATVPGDDDEEF